MRDGANLVVSGYDFAPAFSIWTTIEECLNPPVVWEKDRGWFTLPPFCEPEVFTFPEGIGPVECVHVEHEEVLLIPRWVDCRRATFKYGLGDEFIEVLQTLHKLGLDKTDPVTVAGQQVSPRDVVAACLPDPATLGPQMSGKTCAGTWVTGTGTDGSPERSTSTTWSTTRRPGAETARRRSCGRPRSTPWWPSSCSRPAPGPARGCWDRRRSSPARSSTCSPSTARRGAWRSEPPARRERPPPDGDSA